MKFTSTRNKDLSVGFSQAVKECYPSDGGVFVPSSIEDMRRWIYYIDEKTSFTSIAGSLTSALIKDEFSPIICEKIATDAFSFSPKVSQLDGNLFYMELFGDFTGCHRDFGVSYLCSFLESTLQLTGGNVILLDFTHKNLGATLANVLKGKNHIKSVCVYQKGTVCGLCDKDFVWNGGNIYPVEMEGTDAQIKSVLSQIFTDKEFVQRFNLSVANTTNVCRLLGQIFTFPYSFAQIKNKTNSDIYYAVDSGNYGLLMAGLYSWRFALPVSGFIIPSTPSLTIDNFGNPVILDSMVDFSKRGNLNPAVPANLERLEDFFSSYKMMMRNFVYPANISLNQQEQATKELYMKYGIYADSETSRAFAAIKERDDAVSDCDCETAVVLTALNHPSHSNDYCRHVLGEIPQMPENIKNMQNHTEIGKKVISSAQELKEIIKSIG